MRQEKLDQIRRDLAEGRHALARARVHGAISSGKATPEAVELAGEIYQALGDPVRAGAYFWTIASDKPEHQEPIEAFERATRHSHRDRLSKAHVATRFHHLSEHFEAHWIENASLEALQAARDQVRRRRQWRQARASGAVSTVPPRLPLGCMFSVLIGALLAAIGALTIWSFVYEAFKRQW
jgi:hypothetical protein